MSNAVLTAVFGQSSSTQGARLVLIAMADEANDEGYLTAYRRSLSHLATKARMDPKSVSRAIARLVELGELEVIRHGTGREQSDYRIRLDALGSSVPPGSTESPPSRDASVPPGSTESPPHHPSLSPDPPSTPLPPTPLDRAAGARAETAPALFEAPSRAARPRDRGPNWDLTFTAFWDVYPRKEAKAAARRAWDKALRRVQGNADLIVAGAMRYRDDPGRDPQYTAHATTWLNQDRWEDDPLPERTDGMNRTERALRRVANEPDPITTGGPRPLSIAARVFALAEENP